MAVDYYHQRVVQRSRPEHTPTWGPKSSRVAAPCPASGMVYDIRDGTSKGSNLFHSFDRFSIGTSNTACFHDPSGIANILSRVTGGERSAIDGTLASTVARANLYLLNPAGVLFGPNARLDVSGSFYVSTADYLRLADGGVFHTNPDPAKRLLTVAPPAAFGFLRENPAAIALQQSRLEVPEGRTLSVVGGVAAC